ncbi:MAG: lysylphosphatidylglycerol synthase transmembrane domain-containing protein [Bacteroidales bacterium]
MKLSARSIITLTIFLLLAIVLLYYAFKDVDFEILVKGFKKANYLWVILSMIVGFAAHTVRALRWKLLLEPLGYNPSLQNTLGALAIGYSANLIFPRIGEVARCASLKKTDKIPLDSLLGTVIVERAFDIISIFSLLAIVFFIRLDFFGAFLLDKALLPIWSKIAALVSYSTLHSILAIVLLAFLIVLIKRNVFGTYLNRKISSIFWGIVDGVKSVYKMQKRKTFFFYTVLLWVLYWLMTWLLVFATNATAQLGPIDALFLMVVGSFGMAAPVQGGFGAFHVITAMALGLYGITWEDGLIFAIISHESQTILFILMSIAFMLLLFAKGMKNPIAQNE